MSADNIKVAVKMRPLIGRESEKMWKIRDNTINLISSSIDNHSNDQFSFDHIFDENTSTQDIFDTIGKPIVESAMLGFNGTIFAYGQTASGKTHTMLGNPDSPGIMVLSIREIFQEISLAESREFLLRISYIEIYNEKINDLLNKDNVDLKVCDYNGDVNVKCTEVLFNSEEQFMRQLNIGNKARHVGETNMNDRSSRSHAIFRIIIESRAYGISDDNEAVQISTLNLVDLAGSECVRNTGAKGARFIEGSYINRSLLSLSLVIANLSDNEPAKYINYRDSKLTRILQASLGGNAKTAIICTVTPTAIDETISTLSFASRAKQIKNKPIVNEVVDPRTAIKSLAREVTNLRTELKRLRERETNNNKIMKLQETILAREKLFLTSNSVCSSNELNRRRTWCMDSRYDPLQPPQFLATPSRKLQPRPPYLTNDRNFIKTAEFSDPIENDSFCNLSPSGDYLTPHKISRQFLTPMHIKRRYQLMTPNTNDVKTTLKVLENELEELKNFTKLERELNILYNSEDNLQKTLEVTLKENEKLRKIEMEYIIHRSGLDDTSISELETKLKIMAEEKDKLQQNNIQLAEKVNNLEDEIEFLCEQEKNSLETQNVEFQKILRRRESELVEKINQLESENKQLRMYPIMEESDNSMSSEIENLKIVNEKLKEELNVKQIKIENQQSMIDALQEKDRKSQQENEVLSSQLVEALEENDLKLKSSTDMNNELNDIIAELRNRNTELEKRTEEIIENNSLNEHKNNKLNEEIKNINCENEQLLKIVDELKDQLNKLSEKLSAKEQLFKETIDTYLQTINDLNEDNCIIGQLKLRNEQFENEIQELKEQRLQLQQELKDLKLDNSSDDQYNQLLFKYESTKQSLGLAIENVTQLEDQLELMKDNKSLLNHNETNNLQYLENQLIIKHQEINNLNIIVTELNVEINNYKNDIKNLNIDLEKLSDMECNFIENIRQLKIDSNLKQHDIDNLNEVIIDLKESNDKLNIDIENLKLKKQKFDDETKCNDDQHYQLQTAIEILTNENRLLQNNNKDFKCCIDNLKNDFEKLHIDYEHLLRNSKTQNGSINDDDKNNGEDMKDVQVKYNLLEEENHMFKNNIENLKSKVKDLEINNQNYCSYIENLRIDCQQQIENNQFEIPKLKSENDILLRKIQDIESEKLNSENKNTEDFQLKIKILESKNLTYINDIENLQIQMENLEAQNDNYRLEMDNLQCDCRTKREIIEINNSKIQENQLYIQNIQSENELLLKKIGEIETENLNIITDNEKLKSQNKNIDMNYQRDIDDLQLKYKHLEKDNQNYRTEVENLQMDYQNQKKIIQSNLLEIQKYQIENQKLSDDIKAKENENIDLQKDNLINHKIIERLQCELISVQNEQKCLFDDYKILQNDYIKLQDEFKDLQNDLKQTQIDKELETSINNSIQIEHNNLQMNYKNLQNQYNNIEAKQQILKSEKNNLQDEYNRLKDIHKCIENEYYNLQNEQKNKNETSDELEKLRIKTIKLEKIIENDRIVFDQTEKECISLKNSYELIDESLKVNKEENNLLKMDNKKLSDNVEKLKKMLETIKNEQYEQNIIMEAELNNLRSEKILFNEKENVHQSEIFQLRKLIETGEFENKQLLDQLEVTSNEHDKYVKDVKNEIHIYKVNIQNSEEQLEKCNEVNRNLTQQKTELENKTIDLTQIIKDMENKLKSLGFQNEKLTMDLTAGTLKDLKLIESLNEQLTESKLREECQLEEIKTIKADLIKLSDINGEQKAKFNDENEKLKEKLSELQKNNSICEFQNEIKNSSTVIVELNDKYNKLEELLKTKENEMNILQKQCSKLSSDLADMKNSKETDVKEQRFDTKRKLLVKENEQLHLRNQHLLTELETLRQDLQKERKNRRYSSHDEFRQTMYGIGLMQNRETMTEPTDLNCNCLIMNEKIKELTKQLKIKECHAIYLSSCLEQNPLQGDFDNIKQEKLNYENENIKLRQKLNKMNLKLNQPAVIPECEICKKLKDKKFMDQCHQTDSISETSKLIEMNGNNDSSIVLSVQIEELKNNLFVMQTKYKEAKSICISRKTQIKSLETEVAGAQNELEILKFRCKETETELTNAKQGLIDLKFDYQQKIETLKKSNSALLEQLKNEKENTPLNNEMNINNNNNLINSTDYKKLEDSNKSLLIELNTIGQKYYKLKKIVNEQGDFSQLKIQNDQLSSEMEKLQRLQLEQKLENQIEIDFLRKDNNQLKEENKTYKLSINKDKDGNSVLKSKTCNKCQNCLETLVENGKQKNTVSTTDKFSQTEADVAEKEYQLVKVKYENAKSAYVNQKKHILFLENKWRVAEAKLNEKR